MLSELVEIRAEDAAVHQGLLFTPPGKTDRIIIHVHGLAGNFYENKFIKVMAEYYTDAGYAFFPFNNRGHDYIADIQKIGSHGTSSFKGGGAYERFEECVHDLAGALGFAERKGFSRICLQGHSTGCNKIACYLLRKEHKDVERVIFMSPCDDIGLMQNDLGENFKKGLKSAEALVKKGMGGTLLDNELVFYPMSAQTYLDYYVEGSSHDIFRYREPGLPFPGLMGIRCPVLALYGTTGEYINISANEALKLLGEKMPGKTPFTGEIVRGANHNYIDRENYLAEKILSWLNRTGF